VLRHAIAHRNQLEVALAPFGSAGTLGGGAGGGVPRMFSRITCRDERARSRVVRRNQQNRALPEQAEAGTVGRQRHLAEVRALDAGMP